MSPPNSHLAADTVSASKPPPQKSWLRDSALGYLAADLPQTLAMFTLIFVPYHLFAQPAWEAITARFSPFQIMFGGTLLLTTTSYWVYALAFSLLDLWQWPKWCWRYKVQPAKHPEASWYRKAAFQAVVNQVVVNLPLGYLLAMHVTGTRDIAAEVVPTVAEAVKMLIPFVVIEELGFYYFHRMLHAKMFYRRIHKKHHEFTAPIALAATYAHPLEHMLSNVIPLALGPVLLQSHVIVMWLWMNFGQLTAITSHCGFALPGFPSPLAHDYHHQVFRANYGVLGLLDWLHGTRGNFTAWKIKWEAGVHVAEQGKEEEDVKME